MIVEETDDGQSSGRARRGYVRSIARVDWNRRVEIDKPSEDSDEEEEEKEKEDDVNWRIVNVTCTASNVIAGVNHSDTQMFQVERIRSTDVRGAGQEADDEATDGENGAGYCGRYTGHICRGQLSNPMSVWYNISSNDQTGGWLNEQLVHGLWEEVVRTLREPCQSAAKVKLKFSAPFCSFLLLSRLFSFLFSAVASISFRFSSFVFF